ncbi:MAG: leucyl aminopeptidase [Cellulosilyticum sp.]|nr:leucyl aminopeptidase [Cellulosilyticum sp.]
MLQIKDVTLQDVDALVVPVLEEQVALHEEINLLVTSKAFQGKEEELFVLPSLDATVKYTLYVGLGKLEDFTSESFKKAIATAVKKAKSLKAKTVGINLCVNEKLCVGSNVKNITEASLLGLYSFDKYKAQTEEKEAMTIYISGVPQEKQERAHQVLEESKNTVDGVILARDLTNEPSNAIYPETLARKVVEIFKDTDVEVEVLDEKQIEEFGMKAFLAVGQSSTHKPRLMVMRYRGEAAGSETLGLVGKGLTYDTGGYSLKPTDSMKTMHSDMGGAAAVIGAMYAIGKNKAKKNVTAVVAACENVIAPDSYKPGDIIGSMAGKTIEIGNTDAEGRLTLADAVTYIIEKEKVNKVIDVATLTGAVLVALGTEYTGVVTNNEEFYNELTTVAEKTGERFWKLPSCKEFAKLNKSTVADLKNIGGRNAGTITAGLFVGEFVKDLPWLHLDIAGTAWSDVCEGYVSKGGTGVPVKTLYGLVATPCPCSHQKDK